MKMYPKQQYSIRGERISEEIEERKTTTKIPEELKDLVNLEDLDDLEEHQHTTTALDVGDTGISYEPNPTCTNIQPKGGRTKVETETVKMQCKHAIVTAKNLIIKLF